MWNKIWNPSNRKVLVLNIVSSFVLNIFLELMERKSFSALRLFMEDRTFIFLYNTLIIFITLSVVFLMKKKYFGFGLICGFWGIIGLVNGIILISRKTPFTAVDLTIAKSIIPVLTSYFSVWQIVLGILLIVFAIMGMVVLFLYCPSAKKSFDLKANSGIVAVFLLIFGLATYLGVGRGLLISKFDNPINGYKDYGVVYGFCVTALDTGIDRPIDYSKRRVGKVMSVMNKKAKEQAEEKTILSEDPNVIFIQLESFFDITDVKNVKVSEDPLPNIHRLQKETTSGYVKVPVYGAGTINTEFEMITGMNIGYFGTGEYPYRSILHKRTSESAAYWLKEKGYTASVIHNNNASFYDRDYVFANLGFDYFVTMENMDIRKYNKVGWAKDSVLTDYIMKSLKASEGRDYIYTISVQGHGDYPSDSQRNQKIAVDGQDWSESYKNMVNYYVNETYEMDAFIGKLVETLTNYNEDTILVVYGDHLPSLDFESNQLKSGSKYKTPYFIWDNFGYNKKYKAEEDEDLSAYQMAAKVLGQVGMSQGTMNRFHQTMKDSKNYKRNMKLLQYDLLYGSEFSHIGQEKLLPSTIKFCVDDVKIYGVKRSDFATYIIGKNFTKYSRVYVNGRLVNTKRLSNFALKIPKGAIKDKDEVVVHQVSKTNENITLNESTVFTVDEEKIEYLTNE